MSNQWVQGPGGPQQWGVPSAAPVNQPTQGWVQGQGESQWGPMQQASFMHQQLHQQPQFPQQPDYHGYPQGNLHHPQLPMSQASYASGGPVPAHPPQNQGAYIQEQLARAREEQRVREVELQKRKMMNMNIAGATPLSSIDQLIGLDNISTSPKPKQKQPTQRKPPVTMATPQQPQSKPRSWTMDTSTLQGVFKQEEEVNFGEFQGPPPPLPQQPSGMGVVPTSSYTHPIPSLSGSPSMGLRGRSTSSPHSTPAQPSRSTSSPHSTPAQPPRSAAGLNASAFPPLYLEVYTHCLKDGALNTELLFPVLMSSGLPKQKLGQLWQQANHQTPGKLTQTELFVLLGLIGLVQAGNVSPKFSDLQKVSSPPVPVLEAMRSKDVPSAVSPAPHTAPQTDDFGSFQKGPSPVHSVPKSSAVSYSASNSSFSTSIPPMSGLASQGITKTTSTFATSKPSPDSLLDTIAGAPLTSTPLTNAPSPGLGDKYGAFSGSQNKTNPVADTGDKLAALSSKATPSVGKTTPIIGTTIPSVSKTAPSVGKTTPIIGTAMPSVSKTAPSVVQSTVQPVGSNTMEDFGSFASVTVPSTNQFASVTVPSQTTNQFADFSTSTTVEGWADFSVPLPTTLTPSHTTAHTHPHTTPLLSGLDSLSLFSSQPLPTATTSSLQPTTGSTAKPSVTDEPRAGKKPLTGLDILNEEMAARLLSKESTPQVVDSRPLVPESLDEFGEFEAFGGVQVKSVPSQESATDSKKPTSDPCEVWRACLIKCGEVMEKCVGVFEGVEETGLLTEIAESEEGRNKLRGIVEVYRLANRVHSSLSEKDSGVVGADYVRAIQSHWRSLQRKLPGSIMTQLHSEAPPTGGGESEATDVLSDTISKCSLCLRGKSVDVPAQNSLDRKREEYSLSLLFHNGQSYHASCANFWINVVQEQLPVLV